MGHVGIFSLANRYSICFARTTVTFFIDKVQNQDVRIVEDEVEFMGLLLDWQIFDCMRECAAAQVAEAANPSSWIDI